MKTLGIALVLVLGAACSRGAESVPAPSSPEAVASDAPVELGASFLIPQKNGAALSHTPSVVFTVDGRRMVTATSDREIVEFDVSTRKLLRKITFPEEGTDAVAIDASGRHAVWVLKKGGLAVMDLRSEKIVARDSAMAATWVAVSPDGKNVAVSSAAKVTLHDLPSLQSSETLPAHEGEVTSLAWSLDGRLLGTTSKDGVVRVRDVATKKTVHEAKKAGALYALAFHPDGGFVAYGGEEKAIYHVQLSSGREDVIARNQPYWITCLGYSQDGSRLAAGDESCDIWLFTLADRKMVFHNKHHVECWLSSIAWAPDQETFLFGCRPNAHAGRPTLWMENQRAEAARSDAVRRSRNTLIRAIDDELAKATEEETKKTLNQYRTSLTQEERLQETGTVVGGWPSNQFGGLQVAFSEPVPQGTNINGAPLVQYGGSGGFRPSADPKKLPAAVQKLAEHHQTEIQNEMKKLGGSYCVNQYKVKK
jgi:WD40 repeat protein